MVEEPEWTPPDEFDEYRLVRQLGRGAMGQVYLAHDIVLDRPVAVKFLGALNPDPVERERFLVEARAVARIQHPNVMSIFRVGEIKGRLYLVTEYVRGQNLADLELPLPWRKVLEIGVSLARGLAAAHRQGVLHRDIKLSNAVIDEGGQVKLLDFGLAKLVDAAVDRTSDASSSRSGERREDLVMVAAANARQMVVQRLADTLKLDKPDATAPTPKAIRNEDTGDPAESRSSAAKRSGAASRSGKASADRGEGEARADTGSGAASRDRQALGGWRSRSASITRAGTVMGTPHYMAPELWLADPASRRSDVYALGVLLYILCAGRPPHDAESPFELAIQVQERDPKPLVELAAGVDPRFAQIIDRCLLRDPYERFAAGDELRTALELLAAPVRSVGIPTGNPYRGLQAFEAEHRSLFFGRSAEVRSVIERLRTDAFVVVAGDSGVGKSSLCRAGVIPSVTEGTLDPARTWRSVVMTPGRFPRQSFITVIARGFGLTEDEVSLLLGEEPEALVRALRKQLGETGACLIFIDQFEEFVTISEPAEVDVIGPLIVRLLAGIPSLRVLATVRGDFLTRVVTVPGLGDEVARGIFLLRPLSPDGAREAIVGPAQAHGVGFESDELVDELVEAGVKGSLPLLQFALAELWESRDKAASAISAAELRKIGGVTGALARHADGVLATLLPAQRTAARRLLMRLVTLENTRASLTEEELSAADDASRAALDALVRGRLLVIKESGDRMVYEIAHEALVGGWAQLAGWLEDEKEARAVRHRLEGAASEWERLGKRGEGLWSAAQLAEGGILDRQTLRPREVDFLDASVVNLARVRLLRRLVIAGVPVLIVLLGVGLWLQGKYALQERIAVHVDRASALLGGAQSQAKRIQARRTEALTKFDSGDREAAEAEWSELRREIDATSRVFLDASQELEMALGLDAESEDLHEALARALYERAAFHELYGDPAAVDELLARITVHDEDGSWRARWDEPGGLRVISDPPGVGLVLRRYDYDEDGSAHLSGPLRSATSPADFAELPRGSYLVELAAPGQADVRLPVVIARREVKSVEVMVPRADAVPTGYVYVPAGTSLVGFSGDDDLRRSFFDAVPLHVVATGNYVIARNETTIGEYIAFLDELDEEERQRYLPRADGAALGESMTIARGDDGEWQIEWRAGGEVVTARAKEPFRYKHRALHQEFEWFSFPISGVNASDVEAYVHWLDRSGRVRGARLCSEVEWERAVRGADGRWFPHGNRLRPEEANIDASYHHQPLAMGPDAVGLYPQSASPFGVEDAAGNVFEWVSSSYDSGVVVRGGSFYFPALVARAVNRQLFPPETRSVHVGLRVCASYPPVAPM